MSGRLDALGIHCGKGSEMVEDGGQLIAQSLHFGVVETDAGKERYVFDVFRRKAHGSEDSACALYRLATGKVGPMLHSLGMSHTALEIR